MLNESADYALRAALFLAQQEGPAPTSASDIARALGMPRNYLGKVLHALARAHVVESVRGPRGGFRLAVRPEVLTLAEVVAPFQRLPKRDMCLLGDRACDPANPCASHRSWQSIIDHVTAFFRATTIASLLGEGAREEKGEPVFAAEPSEPAA